LEKEHLLNQDNLINST